MARVVRRYGARRLGDNIGYLQAQIVACVTGARRLRVPMLLSSGVFARTRLRYRRAGVSLSLSVHADGRNRSRYNVMRILISINRDVRKAVGWRSRLRQGRGSRWRVGPQRVECEQCPRLLERDLGAHSLSATDLAAALLSGIPLPSAIVAALQLHVSCNATIVMSFQSLPVAWMRNRTHAAGDHAGCCCRSHCEWDPRAVNVLVAS